MSSFRFGRDKSSITLVHGASATTVDAAKDINGLLRQVIIKTPTAVDGSATVDVSILDSDSNVVYTKTGLAANTTSINLLTADTRVPLAGTQTIRVVFSAAQTTVDRVTTVVLLVEKG